MITIKEKVRGNCKGISDISILGIVICNCCFIKWIDKLNEKELNNLKDNFCWVSSNNIISWPDGVILFGKDITLLDENKSLIEHKKEMELQLIEFGLMNNKEFTIYSENVEFLFGTFIEEEIDIDDEEGKD